MPFASGSPKRTEPVGILLDKPTHVVWVKTWSELIRECEARLHFITEKLQIEVTAEEIEERIAQLKASILKEEAEPAAEKLAEESEEVMDDGRPLAPSQAGAQRSDCSVTCMARRHELEHPRQIVLGGCEGDGSSGAAMAFELCLLVSGDGSCSKVSEFSSKAVPPAAKSNSQPILS